MILSKEAVLNILSDVKDPEVPVLSILDLGIVRDVVVTGEEVNPEDQE